MKKKMIAAMTALAMVASTGSVVFADEVNYDVENHEFKDVTITIHTRWDEADV